MKWMGYLLLAASFAIIAAALGLVAPGLLGVEPVYAYGAAVLLFVLALHIAGVFLSKQEVRTLETKLALLHKKMQNVTSESDRLGQGLDNVDDRIAERIEEENKHIVSELKVLQTLLTQIISKSPAHASAALGKADKVGAANKKAKGKDRRTVSSKGRRTGIRPDSGEIFSIIQNALKENRVDLYLQPVVSLPARRTVHYECFSRVRDGDGDIIFPRQYLPMVEESGLVGTLDNLLLFRCIQLIRRLGNRRPEVRFFCNISSASLHDEEFFPQFVEYMANHQDLAGRLVFEFAQADVDEMDKQIERTLASLGRRGFRFSLDQVAKPGLDIPGLAKKHFGYIKIDADILMAGSSDIHPADMKDAFKRHDISMIVSKIEDERTVVDILDFNVDFGQGYLFGEPKPSRETSSGNDKKETAAAQPAGFKH